MLVFIIYVPKATWSIPVLILYLFHLSQFSVDGLFIYLFLFFIYLVRCFCQLDVRSLSEDGTSITNPYPIYSTVNKNCLQHDSEKGTKNKQWHKHTSPNVIHVYIALFRVTPQSFCFCFSVFVSGKWFEMTPHQAGFIDVGLFINTTNLGSRIHGAGSDVKGPELDMVTLQGASISFSARNTSSPKTKECNNNNNFYLVSWALNNAAGATAVSLRQNILGQQTLNSCILFIYSSNRDQIIIKWTFVITVKRSCKMLFALHDIFSVSTK